MVLFFLDFDANPWAVRLLDLAFSRPVGLRRQRGRRLLPPAAHLGWLATLVAAIAALTGADGRIRMVAT
jgi:hypothetical protein